MEARRIEEMIGKKRREERGEQEKKNGRTGVGLGVRKEQNEEGTNQLG